MSFPLSGPRSSVPSRRRPADLLSTALRWILRFSGALAIALIVLALAGPYHGGETLSRVGEGAQVVILLDRSGSMNDTFAGRTPEGGAESKAAATKRILRDFVGRRPHDLFGVAAFSTSPILVLPLTDHRDAVRAAIDASDRAGLDYTDMARGLAMALSMFATDRADEHHVILLVSDGGAVIESHVQDLLRAEFRKFRTDLYFLFLRTAGSKGMFDQPEPGENLPQAMPERFLNLFFQTLDIPYKPFEAENPEQVEAAIHEIDKLERHPIVYTERLPRHDLTGPAYALACLCIGLLVAAKLAETPLVPRQRSSRTAGAAKAPG
ncbi:MxaC protein involved in methanol oxidation, (VWA domain-containing protein) [Methylocella tundrae]|uniref:MxaC protein involved in methanol oxidation, (VWA domain-containing protein) n=1 Tax=Methylocella tundrae TaxID=227605 RepID=A0A4U8YZF3_METTU|nr:vWA domain-containing protein [Methylocella tundrae]VFU08497.1 MxaC protein involved in methanol oxidation, (VWA domain-containing protein) [Methylocella tundrae]